MRAAFDPADWIDRLGFNTASLPGRSLEHAAREGHRLGLRGIEILAFEGYRHTRGDLAGVWLDRLEDADRDRLLAILEPFDHVAVHAPFWDVAPFAANPAVRAASRQQLLAIVRNCAAIGASTVTTHVIPRVGFALEEFRADVVDFYRRVGDVAADHGMTVTIETGYPQGIDEFASLIVEIGHLAVGANVDVGHLRGLLSEEERRPEALEEAYNALLRRHVRSLGRKIYHTHMHDVHAEGIRDHRECGTGVIDFEALLRELRSAGYHGLMNFELEEPDAAGALERSRARLVRAIEALR